MNVLSFPRGIHPHDEKEHTNEFAIKDIFPDKGAQLVYPMSQHLGAPATPIVSVGDYVKVGQKIAEASAFVSSPIHASVSGNVVAIEKRATSGGTVAMCVVVENDDEYSEIDTINGNVDYTKLSKEEILEKVKDYGIVGLGGAGFPTHIKLNPPEDKKIDHIIINAAECEPFLTSDYRVLLEESDKLIEGVKIILQIHKDAQAVIGIETNKMKAIEIMQEKVKDIPNISIAKLKPKYPQGSEKQLIFAITGREVPSGKLPADVGCIVNNVDTVIAIHRAIVRNRPLMRRIVTLSGDCYNNPGNYKIRIGMSLNELIEKAGGLKQQPEKIISGGPMMGVSIYSLDVPIGKTNSAFLCFSKERAYIGEESNCIRCGRCVSHCPSGLLPLELNKLVIKDDLEGFEACNGLDCIECGSCSFICPAKRHLAQSIRYARRTVLASKRK